MLSHIQIIVLCNCLRAEIRLPEQDTEKLASWLMIKNTTSWEENVTFDISNLLCVDGIPRELSEMDEFKMQGPKLS